MMSRNIRNATRPLAEDNRSATRCLVPPPAARQSIDETALMAGRHMPRRTPRELFGELEVFASELRVSANDTDEALVPTETGGAAEHPLPPSVHDRLSQLTPRERQVLRHVLSGQLSKQIARDLGISPRTVELHRSRIMDKMQASNLAKLVSMLICDECAKKLAEAVGADTVSP